MVQSGPAFSRTQSSNRTAGNPLSSLDAGTSLTLAIRSAVFGSVDSCEEPAVCGTSTVGPDNCCGSAWVREHEVVAINPNHRIVANLAAFTIQHFTPSRSQVPRRLSKSRPGAPFLAGVARSGDFASTKTRCGMTPPRDRRDGRIEIKSNWTASKRKLAAGKLPPAVALAHSTHCWMLRVYSPQAH